MILNEREMRMARELARDIVRAEREKERERTRQSVEILRNAISNAALLTGSLGRELAKAVINLSENINKALKGV